MGNIRAEMRELVDQFLANVAEVAREAARQTLMARLRGEAASIVSSGALQPSAEGPPVTGKPRAGASDAACDSVRRADWRKGEKRPVGELIRLRARLRAFIAENPGLRAEEIYAALGLTRREIALPLRKLVADGEVRAEGEKRATRYHPSSADVRCAPAAPPPAPVVRRRR